MSLFKRTSTSEEIRKSSRVMNSFKELNVKSEKCQMNPNFISIADIRRCDRHRDVRPYRVIPVYCHGVASVFDHGRPTPGMVETSTDAAEVVDDNYYCVLPWRSRIGQRGSGRFVAESRDRKRGSGEYSSLPVRPRPPAAADRATQPRKA